MDSSDTHCEHCGARISYQGAAPVIECRFCGSTHPNPNTQKIGIKRKPEGKAKMLHCKMCFGPVSSQANNCPKCGHPVEQEETAIEPKAPVHAHVVRRYELSIEAGIAYTVGVVIWLCVALFAGLAGTLITTLVIVAIFIGVYRGGVKKRCSSCTAYLVDKTHNACPACKAILTDRP